MKIAYKIGLIKNDINIIQMKVSLFSAASGRRDDHFDQKTDYSFAESDTSAATGQKNGQSDQIRNFANGNNLANRRERWARRGYLNRKYRCFWIIQKSYSNSDS